MLRRVVEVKCDTIGLKSSSIGFTPKCGIIEAAKLPASGEEGISGLPEKAPGILTESGLKIEVYWAFL